jgi:hypothetical protein
LFNDNYKILIKNLEMNKVILQLWEESNTKEGFLSDGCSLHLNVEERNIYVSSIYDGRDNSIIPDEYDRTVGKYLEVFVEDKLFNMISEEKSVKINESAFQNLIKFEEITFNEATI